MCINGRKQNGKSNPKAKNPSWSSSYCRFCLGDGITKEDAEITGSWLPTNKQVIRYDMFHRQEGTSEPPTKQKNKQNRLSQICSRKSYSILSQKKHFQSYGISKNRLWENHWNLAEECQTLKNPGCYRRPLQPFYVICVLLRRFETARTVKAPVSNRWSNIRITYKSCRGRL